MYCIYKYNNFKDHRLTTHEENYLWYENYTISTPCILTPNNTNIWNPWWDRYTVLLLGYSDESWIYSIIFLFTWWHGWCFRLDPTWTSVSTRVYSPVTRTLRLSWTSAIRDVLSARCTPSVKKQKIVSAYNLISIFSGHYKKTFYGSYHENIFIL